MVREGNDMGPWSWEKDLLLVLVLYLNRRTQVPCNYSERSAPSHPVPIQY